MNRKACGTFHGTPKVQALIFYNLGLGPLFRFCRSLMVGLGALCALQNSTAAVAQGLDIQPITLEIMSDVSQDTELLLASVSLPSNTAPLIEGILAGSSGVVKAAVRTSDGLPKPSVILGFIAPGQETLFGLTQLLPATLAGIIFSLDDLAAREALRSSDPEMFKRLVEEGHVDPNPSQLNRVLQGELKRMNCYRSGIDGAWGSGSRRSVGEYFEQLENVDWEDPAPSADLFRAVLLNGDVDCPTPAAVQRSTRTQGTTTRSTTTRRTTTAKPKAAAPAKKPASKKPSISLGGSTGVFR